MNLCNDGHQEICYNSVYCPMCTLIKDHSDEIDEKNAEIADKIKEIQQVEHELEAYTE